MTIEEILSNVTILNDCSKSLSGDWIPAILVGAIAAILGIWWFIIRFWESFGGEKAAEITFAVMGLFLMAFSLWQCLNAPPQIDYYICTNDVEIEQLAEYFNVSELSQVNDLTVCHITPKAEFYDEIPELRDNRKGD